MSSGRVHALANTAVLVTTVIVTPIYLPLPLAAGAITGALAGLILTPDIDLPGTTHEEIRIYKHLGFFGGGMWQLFWNHYARTHSHRGSSHAPFRGTAGRWWYAFKRLWPVLALALYFFGAVLADYPYECALVVCMVFLFNVLQDLMHLALDGWRYHHHR